LLANDHDQDAGAQLAISAVDTNGTLGTVNFDAVNHTLSYAADDDLFDTLAPGATYIDHFNYTVTDEHGLTSTATVDVTVTGIDDGITVHGGPGNNTLSGTAGEDQLYAASGNNTVNGLDGHDLLDGGAGNDTLNGGGGNDQLYGQAGNDVLNGGAGMDVLFGGAGNDSLAGGSGADIFHFGAPGGNDTVIDFNIAEDSIVLDDGVTVQRTKVQDVNHDGVKDLQITLSNGSLTLLGVSDLGGVKFATADTVSTHSALFGSLQVSNTDMLFHALQHDSVGLF
jgi:Ca2+-binding RTX toxin-like protein